MYADKESIISSIKDLDLLFEVFRLADKVKLYDIFYSVTERRRCFLQCRLRLLASEMALGAKK